jgi:hypothetical protein
MPRARKTYYMIRTPRWAKELWAQCRSRFRAVSGPELLALLIQHALEHPDAIADYIGRKLKEGPEGVPPKKEGAK